MRFYWQRYLAALATYRRWLWLATVPALAFCLVAAARPDRYSVTQGFTLRAPHAVTAAHLMPYLSNRIPLVEPDGAYPVVGPTAQRTLRLIPAGGERVELVYLGVDPANGRELVRHYTEKLLREAQQAAAATEVTVERDGEPRSAAHRALWRADRWPAFFRFLAGGALLLLAVLGVREALDPALKSERQATRYLGIPLLGTVPKLPRTPRQP